ncbi:DUF485 domain-containing protein [Streptomyces albipurpureus]|uniref:DUF485 domain-containing protein n=1 Tax=Streptomyces albipurpureus TaxID=2897419 RepID=A0ABT0UYJ6_9ACTN|nr:DUF485 domain-containing protein [Streptomyces sp. CWNU-1]MCM2393642.1 DUF485 domain-containing protein [Streptomyces sp. CWNU-1]
MEKQAGRHAAAVRLDDPWCDALGSGWSEPLDSGLGWGAIPAEVPVPGWGAHRALDAPPGEEEWPGLDPRAPGGCEALTPTSGHAHPQHGDRLSTADIYLEVQRSDAFQRVRRRYRGFVVPVGLAFLLWYFGYVIAAIAAPTLMARPVVGAVNVAMLAGLAQFLTTFLLTWAYARHARLHRDPEALELRWLVFDWDRARRIAPGEHGEPGEPGSAGRGSGR